MLSLANFGAIEGLNVTLWKPEAKYIHAT